MVAEIINKSLINELLDLQKNISAPVSKEAISKKIKSDWKIFTRNASNLDDLVNQLGLLDEQINQAKNSSSISNADLSEVIKTLENEKETIKKKTNKIKESLDNVLVDLKATLSEQQFSVLDLKNKLLSIADIMDKYAVTHNKNFLQRADTKKFRFDVSKDGKDVFIINLANNFLEDIINSFRIFGNFLTVCQQKILSNNIRYDAPNNKVEHIWDPVKNDTGKDTSKTYLSKLSHYKNTEFDKLKKSFRFNSGQDLLDKFLSRYASFTQDLKENRKNGVPIPQTIIYTIFTLSGFFSVLIRGIEGATPLSIVSAHFVSTFGAFNLNSLYEKYVERPKNFDFNSAKKELDNMYNYFSSLEEEYLSIISLSQSFADRNNLTWDEIAILRSFSRKGIGESSEVRHIIRNSFSTQFHTVLQIHNDSGLPVKLLHGKDNLLDKLVEKGLLIRNVKDNNSGNSTPKYKIDELVPTNIIL